MVQALFPDCDDIFKDGNAPIYTAHVVKNCYEEHTVELRHMGWAVGTTISGCQYYRVFVVRLVATSKKHLLYAVVLETARSGFNRRMAEAVR